MEKQIAVSIVEDQVDIRRGMQEIFNSTPGFLCLSVFEDAETALMHIPDEHPDIVIMDINLPGMNGISCITQIKAQCPNVQFMMFTIYENSEYVLDALAAGASGYLLKNTPPDKMIEAVKELYDGGSPMNSNIARKLVAAYRQVTTPATGNVFNISEREKEVLDLLAKGLLYKEIGLKLGISTGTVKQHIHKIYEKLHVQNRTEALNKIFGSQQQYRS